MKKNLNRFTGSLLMLFAFMNASAQTNTFPATGNVGIGTLVPAEKLNVITATGVNGITHSDGSIKLSTFLNAGAGYLGPYPTIHCVSEQTAAAHRLSFCKVAMLVLAPPALQKD